MTNCGNHLIIRAHLVQNKFHTMDHVEHFIWKTPSKLSVPALKIVYCRFHTAGVLHVVTAVLKYFTDCSIKLANNLGTAQAPTDPSLQ